MELNPCKQCNSTEIQVDEEYTFCSTRYCRSNVEHDGTLQKAIAAWNTANPTNDAKMEQNEALNAVQQALAAVLMYFYSENQVINRTNVKYDCDTKALDLLIAQGVLVEIDGRITLK